MNVAIIGSEDPRSVGQALGYILTLPADTTVATTGDKGVGVAAWLTARDAGMSTVVYLPRFATEGTPYTSTDYLKRNQDMIAFVEMVVCFHETASKGSEDIMRRAFHAFPRRRVLVYAPGESVAWGDARHTG